ncbi:probable transmembrane GTPase FZO-like, chloroplastic isoform X2 [Magnolia sinica]|uniref:probable transmembrane GTPase FZO-like, chloroplastic isoform X2 n=1 Tax=Magnolia sinica TaxID=86752 RepID=UPI0026582BDD|nr:probable transmembrane GTPase FZO-like, chloroplastic isoform X2 [Magnolia sinica]
MVSLLSNSTAFCLSKSPLLPLLQHVPRSTPRFPSPRFHPPSSINASAMDFSSNSQPQQQPLRTLFPGGFKRPEIKVPTLVLQLDCEEVLRRDDVLDSINVAISKWAGIVVLGCREESGGGQLYEAACVLKSVIRDRAYLLVVERVDIAAAVGASGVVLSDKGLPTIVARNMMMESKSDSVILPLVARIVQTANSALNASSSEGADFLILGIDREKHAEALVSSVCQHVKVPVFTMTDLIEEGVPSALASKLLQSGASGMVVCLKDIKLLTDDILSKMFSIVYAMNRRTQDEFQSSNESGIMDVERGLNGKRGMAGFTQVEDKEKQFIEAERLVLREAISVICKAAPQMEEVSLLVDAVSRLDDPFLLVIVGEFNSGKSTVINALLGRRYLKEGVIPTTNEITFLCYSEMDSSEQQRCERHPDGQFICYLPAPILKEMNLVDTPGTNVILQRQQRLTEEFVPRADLVLFVISADRPLTESEVAFLRYIQQWKKKVVFVLNKSDLYQNISELEEAIAFIKENTRKLLNTEHVTLYPVSARSALEAKLSASLDVGKDYAEVLSNDPRWKSSSFCELENFLFSFLDGSTDTGIERMRLKLETPIGIADRLLTACESFVKQECEFATQDLMSVAEIIGSVKEFSLKMESESISWRKRTLSLIETTKARAVKLTESTLQLSNLDLVASYFIIAEKTSSMPATSNVQNEIIGPALLDAERLLGEYLTWLQSSNAREGRRYKESFEKRWPAVVKPQDSTPSESYELMTKKEDISLQIIENFSPSAAAKLLDQELREVVFGTFGGLGAAGLSASLLTSVLPTTLEDLLALGFCSAGGLLAISSFPNRRKEVTDKVKRAADALARQLEEAMLKDLSQALGNLERWVKFIGRPYQDAAQHSLDRMLGIQEELSNIGKKLQRLQIEIQNLHVR